MQKFSELQVEILKLKKQKNAIIMAHYYQTPEIQDIADFLGDSLQLSQEAAKTNAPIIVFAGVKFMAETAKILNPEKKVLLPDLEAGCSLADSCKPKDLLNFIDKNKPCKVVSYINCSAEVKTMSDIICTSSNAIKVVNSFAENERIIFAPDKNLGNYVNRITGRNMILWDGSCEVHDLLKTEQVIELKNQNPDAKLIAHPECKGQILEIADFVGSTTALLHYTINNEAKKFIIATESGVIHQMKKASPNKEFIIVPADKNCLCNDCPFMKKITLEKILNCLKNESNEIILDKILIEKAKKPIVKMLEIQ